MRAQSGGMPGTEAEKLPGEPKTGVVLLRTARQNLLTRVLGWCYRYSPSLECV